ncbi:MAG: hypothetical protein HUU54_05720 [Ignavibacteriaceae bacterium]|nr:hypothetical protein [Ignavibacteriaceae bacterium]
MTPPDLTWVRQREGISHDQLPKFTTRLCAAITQVKINRIAITDLRIKLKLWEDLRDNIKWLIDNYETYQTLLCFLRLDPLKNADDFQKKLLVVALKAGKLIQIYPGLPLISDLVFEIDFIYADICKHDLDSSTLLIHMSKMNELTLKVFDLLRDLKKELIL